jgi:uncharacterized protein (DUF2147 family)
VPPVHDGEAIIRVVAEPKLRDVVRCSFLTVAKREDEAMHKSIGSAMAAAMLLAAGVAYADNLEGTIEELDRDTNTMIVDGEVFNVSEVMTAGKTLDDLKEGDKVNVFYKEKQNEDNQHHALQVDKIEE